MIENLNKENFWNELQKECPEALDYFCKWIDAYKNEVDWNFLFGNNQLAGRAIKFHDIPFEMQNGIIARFEIEQFNNRTGTGKLIAKQICIDYKQQVRNLFLDLQQNIQKRKQKLN